MDLRSTFGLHATPFTREIRIEDQLTLPMHEEALDGLRRALDGRMSGALIAPSGTGKTALLRRLVAGLPEARYQVRTVKVTGLSKRDLCREIAVVCGVSSDGTYPALVRRLTERFETTLDDGGLRPVLVLDEAHELRPEVLSMLRLLTNFKMDSRLVLSIVLSGQPPLATLLRRDDQEAIARRLVYYATLRTFSDAETRAYVEHRWGHKCPGKGGRREGYRRGDRPGTDPRVANAADTHRTKTRLYKAGCRRIYTANSTTFGPGGQPGGNQVATRWATRSIST